MTGIDDFTERIAEALSPLIGTKIDAMMGKKINKAMGTMRSVRLSKVKGGWKRIPKRRWGQEIVFTSCNHFPDIDVRFS